MIIYTRGRLKQMPHNITMILEAPITFHRNWTFQSFLPTIFHTYMYIGIMYLCVEVVELKNWKDYLEIIY
ncbi:unnamed protein product [Rhizophagus irregularis]|nr:unnamed protein product [Rhizophagus irregularis]